MAMRYILRRNKPEDLSSIKKDIPNLESQLEKAGDGYKRNLELSITNMERINYQFQTRKSGTEWVWVCPSVELVAENETGLFNLMERFSVAPPAHLAHLKK